MDAAAQDRILQVLTETQRDPARLALASVDLRYPELLADERENIRNAMVAAAVPHWFDVPFLAALLDITPEEAAIRVDQITRLSNVEPFPARGETAYNVHEASRLPLREYLRIHQPDLWKLYAQRARDHVAASGAQDHLRIEALFHQFAADSAAAVADCDLLDREVRINPTRRAPLCTALNELVAAGWLQGEALVEASRVPLWFRCSRGEEAALEPEANKLFELAKVHAGDRQIADVQCLMGDIQVMRGNLKNARAAFEKSLGHLYVLDHEQPDVGLSRDLLSSLIKLGNVAIAQGNLDEAARLFTDSKAIAERIVASDPTHAAWQRDLVVTMLRLADVVSDQGDRLRAAELASAAEMIACEWSERDPENATWQRDHATSFIKLGDVNSAQGKFDVAAQLYGKSKTILERLLLRDSDNAAVLHHLAIAFVKLGDAACALKVLIAAEQSYERAKAILADLTTRDRSNAEWQRSLSIALNKLGDLTLTKDGPTRAAQFYEDSMFIRERLSQIDAANATWQRDLSYSYWVIAAKIHEPLQKWLDALHLMQRCLEISSRLTALDRSNLTWQQDEQVSRAAVERLRAKVGQEG